MNEKLLNDFCKFSRFQIESWDIDPVYPVLKQFYIQNGLDPKGERAHWFTLLYVTFYHLGSASEIYNKYPSRKIPIREDLTMPTGIERRGFRGNNLANKFVLAAKGKLRDHHGFRMWIAQSIIAGRPKISWKHLREEFQTLPYAGPWASYKWADLLKNVHDWPISANDIGVGGKGETAGPIPGMVAITGFDWKECANNVSKQLELMTLCRKQSVPFNGLDQLETCLCDFNSMIKGHYYSGHDIDMQMEQLPKNKNWWRARRKVIPEACRGEAHDWDGVRKNLKTLYRDKGEIYSDLL